LFDFFDTIFALDPHHANPQHEWLLIIFLLLISLLDQLVHVEAFRGSFRAGAIIVLLGALLEQLVHKLCLAAAPLDTRVNISLCMGPGDIFSAHFR